MKCRPVTVRNYVLLLACFLVFDGTLMKTTILITLFFLSSLAEANFPKGIPLYKNSSNIIEKIKKQTINSAFESLETKKILKKVEGKLIDQSVNLNNEFSILKDSISNLGKNTTKKLNNAFGQVNALASNSLKKLNNLGEQEFSDQLLITAISTGIGLASGGALVTNLIGGLDKVIRLYNDSDKIKSKIFLASLTDLENKMNTLDELIPSIEQTKKLLKIQQEISPVLNLKDKDYKESEFVENLSCKLSNSHFEKMKFKAHIFKILKNIKNPDFYKNKLCIQLSKIDQLRSNIDLLGLRLNSNFDGHKNRVLDQLESEAKSSLSAYIKRNEENNPFINEVREEFFSCIDNNLSRKGTFLEDLFDNDYVLNHPKILGKVKKGSSFRKYWNSLFGSHVNALTRTGVTSNISPSEFNDKISLIINSQKCFQNFGNSKYNFERCFRNNYFVKQPQHFSGMISDEMKYSVLNYLSDVEKKVSKNISEGKKATHGLEEHEVDAFKSFFSRKNKMGKSEYKFRKNFHQLINNPYGNLIMLSGPSTLQLSGNKRIYSDVGMLNCNNVPKKDSELCNKMLGAFKEISVKYCSKFNEPDYVKNESNKRLKQKIELYKKDLMVKITREKERLYRLGKFVESLTVPDTDDIENKLRALEKRREEFEASGICQ
tara:strand:- start:487 stop:2466 length:1980 start_codon:yes stop_codon:yes gene_type:complete